MYVCMNTYMYIYIYIYIYVSGVYIYINMYIYIYSLFDSPKTVQTKPSTTTPLRPFQGDYIKIYYSRV